MHSRKNIFQAFAVKTACLYSADSSMPCGDITDRLVNFCISMKHHYRCKVSAKKKKEYKMKTAVSSWVNSVIKQDEIDKYLINGKDFIDDELINKQILENRNPEKSRIREIMAKSLDLQRLDPVETAALLDVTDPELLSEMYETGLKVNTDLSLLYITYQITI